MSQTALKRCRQCKLNSSADSSPVVRFLQFLCYSFSCSCLCFFHSSVRWLLQPNQTENTRARRKKGSQVYFVPICVARRGGFGKYVCGVCTHKKRNHNATNCMPHAAFSSSGIELRCDLMSTLRGEYKLRLVRWGESIQIAFEWPRKLLANLIYGIWAPRGFTILKTVSLWEFLWISSYIHMYIYLQFLKLQYIKYDQFINKL